jgi:GT2 family glycosyltransferase
MKPADLPSLRAFQPRFYAGGPIRFHLPLLYDLVATVRPRRVVVLGFGNGAAFCTLCQAVREQKITCQCLGFAAPGDDPAADADWLAGAGYVAENYGDFARLLPNEDSSANPADVDFLLLDDCDEADLIRRQLQAWSDALAPQNLVLFHGTRLERNDPPRAAWRQWLGQRPVVELPLGIGLGLSWSENHPAAASMLFRTLLTPNDSALGLADLYTLAAERIEARHLSAELERERDALSARQVWLESLLEDRWKAQETMDAQAEQMAAYLRDRETLRADRARAQLIMDAQAEQLKQWVARGEALNAERKKLKSTVAEQKRILNAAKKACRRRGKCFPTAPNEKKERRSIPARILRELRRIPANLSRIAKREGPEPTPETVVVVDRYAEWIAEHEPDPDTLERQRALASELSNRPKISFLLPTYNTPPEFLDELLASVVAQTYDNFEICLVDGGSTNHATIDCLKAWQAKEPRLEVEFLPANLGVAENTNHALALASGDFVVCIDHDDKLAPFALFELAKAITANPNAEIFYSDEDRLDKTGRRHSPFFKPDWNPEYLLSSMYLGHLTAYRSDLVQRVGRFRPEFDLSQDYDFALRATELASEIVHIPHVLYHWREHPASGSAGGKPHARQTNLAALAAAMERRQLKADVLEYSFANRARLTILDWPKVSIVIPTDSAERGKLIVEELPKGTSYPDYEVVLVTNSGLAGQLETIAPSTPRFRFVRYDQPFNFSAKCNLGAETATGTRLIFFNDDVESTQPDWIENLIEPLENPAIGAVAPKMLYETGKIQHAGLVTGVRGSIGTACHQWPSDSTDYVNFAQSMRAVAALSGACLAMRRDDFFAIGEWDVENVPIAHSDLDLSFKIRDAGLRCVYTPFVMMRHRGHASIGAAEEVAPPAKQEKVSIFLLKRWPQYTCYDPYFPPNLRDWIYHDSPTPLRMWAPDEQWTRATRADLLFVSHDLSWSGAPMILLQLAQWLRERGYFVTVMSPLDGPMRARFVAAGMAVVVDPLITSGHESFARLASEFDGVVASTIFGAPIVQTAKQAGVPHIWWIHEGRVAEHYLNEEEKMRAALARADFIVTPDTASAQVYQPFTNRPIRVIGYGIFDPTEKPLPPPARSPNEQRIRFLLLGTVEYRKGQQVLLNALRRLPERVLQEAEFQIIGRPHDPELAARIKAATGEFPHLTYEESMPHEEALARIRDADVMISASHDETGPLILMEALALGTPILSTAVGGVSERLAGSDAGIFFPAGNDRALAEAIARLVEEPELRNRLRAAARPAFEKHFTFERFGEEFRAVVDEAVGIARPSE